MTLANAPDGFFGMRVSRLVSFGPKGSKDVWEEVGYLSPDAFRFVPKDPNAIQTILLNAGLLGQTPYWLRELMLDRLDGLEATASSAGGRGAAKAPRVPPRILGLGTEPAVARHLSNVRAVGYAGTSRRSPIQPRCPLLKHVGCVRPRCSTSPRGAGRSRTSSRTLLASRGTRTEPSRWFSF